MSAAASALRGSLCAGAGCDTSLLRGLGEGFEVDAVAEGFELADRTGFGLGGDAAGVVVGAGDVTLDGEVNRSATMYAGNADVRQADLGVTGCDCLIARTGSIAVSTRSTGGRALSVLPPVHLVIERRDQLVPDLTAALALWHQRYDRHWPSNLSVITGPSRTGDIEKILVMGAHGPKRLALYFTE